MADPALPPSAAGKTPGRGITAEFMSLLASFGEHVQALVSLAGLESREAAGVYFRALIAVVAGLVLLLFAYLLLLLFVAFALATFAGIAWIWICLGLGVLHLIGVAACGIYVKARLKSPVFTATSAELQRDFAALKQHQP